MIDLKLKYNLVHKWYSENGISVIGTAFLSGSMLKEASLCSYFKEALTENLFAEKLQKLHGHFAIVSETATGYLIAVDIIRTFPLFIRNDKYGILISDCIESDEPDWNETASAIFKKIYCVSENNTLVKNWMQLQAGEFAVISKKDFSISLQTYYHHSNTAIDCDKETLQDKLRVAEQQLIRSAVQYADSRTILIPLSGGYDSRYLLALLAASGYTNIECYTYGKKDSFEVLIAKNVCEQLGIKWHFIEYTEELLLSFFSEKWNTYSTLNHNFSSLPHEQDFFALHYLKEHKLLPGNAVIMNGFCQDILTGSFIEPVKNFDLQKFIFHKHQLNLNADNYENSWNGYQEWLVKNRLTKFIVNSVRVYEYFGLDFYLPFWNKDWIDFWYTLNDTHRLHQQFYTDELFNGIFKTYKIDYKKPTHNSTGKWYTLKRISKTVLPERITRLLQSKNVKDSSKDVNNTLFLYGEIYNRMKEKPLEKDFRINNIHALYLLQILREKHQL